MYTPDYINIKFAVLDLVPNAFYIQVYSLILLQERLQDMITIHTSIMSKKENEEKRKNTRNYNIHIIHIKHIYNHI